MHQSVARIFLSANNVLLALMKTEPTNRNLLNAMLIPQN